MLTARGSLIVVEGYVPAGSAPEGISNIRDDVMAFALDQRAFGPRKLLVAFGERDGRFRGLAYTARIAPIDAAFEACLDYLGAGAATAVAFLDEAVSQGEPTKSQMKRFHRLEAMAARYGITLVDWISCDDELIRLARGGRCDPDDWWPQYEDV